MSVFYQILLCLVINFNFYTAERYRYISVEYPQITHLNPKIISYANSSVRRYSRKDPVYYYELHANVLVPLDNKFSYQFYFYKEWMPNVYKPTFLEMHYKHCDLLEKDKLFGRTMRQGKLSGPCPHPPGEYHLYNMSVPSAELPESFPFTKGRLYGNLTYTEKGKKPIPAGGGYVNIEIKLMDRKHRN